MTTQGQMYAVTTDYFVLSPRELQKVASEVAQLDHIIADERTRTWAERESAKARRKELQRVLDSDRWGREMRARKEGRVPFARNARRPASKAAPFAEVVTRRNATGQAIEVKRLRLPAKAEAVVNEEPETPQFLPPVPYYLTAGRPRPKVEPTTPKAANEDPGRARYMPLPKAYHER